MVIAVAGLLVVLVFALFVALRRRFAGEVFTPWGGLARNADLLARVEALTAIEWGVRTRRPISQALWSIIPEVSRRQQLKLRKVAAAIEEGATLTAAMAKAPRIFPGPLRSIVGSAEAAGALVQVMPALAERGRGERAALTWTIALFLMPLAATVFAAGTLGQADRINEIAAAYGGTAPLARVGESASAIAVVWPFALLAVLWILAMSRRWHGPRALQRWVGQWIPGVRGVVQARWVADASGLLAALLEAGMPLEQALAVTSGIESTRRQSDRLRLARATLAAGTPAVDAMALALPAWANWRLRWLAAANRPAEALRAVSEEATRLVTVRVRRLTACIHPVTSGLLAVAVFAWLAQIHLMNDEVTWSILNTDGFPR